MILFVESKKERGWSIARHNRATTLKIKWPTTRLESSMERPWVTEPWLLAIIAGWEQKMQTLSYSVRNRKQSHFHHWFPLHGKWPGSCLSRPWWHVSSPAVPFHLLRWPPHEHMPHTSMNLTPWRTARFATIRFTRASYRSISSRMESRNCLPLDQPYIRTSPSCMSTTSKGEGTVSWPLCFWENRITVEPESVRCLQELELIFGNLILNVCGRLVDQPWTVDMSKWWVEPMHHCCTNFAYFGRALVTAHTARISCSTSLHWHEPRVDFLTQRINSCHSPGIT